MRESTEKQRLALKRGQLLRYVRGIEGITRMMLLHHPLSSKERSMLHNMYNLTFKFQADFIETGIEMGLKRKKIINNIEIINDELT